MYGRDGGSKQMNDATRKEGVGRVPLTAQIEAFKGRMRDAVKSFEATRTDYVEVFQCKGIWNVRYTSEPLKGEVIRLFGTNVLQTPYDAGMTFAEVHARLSVIPANRYTAFVEGREVR